MRATAPTLRRQNFARAEATRAWVEATKRQVIDTSDDSLSDANSLNSLSDNSLNSLDSLSDDNSLSDSDAGQQQPPQTTNPPQLTGAARTRQRLTAGQRQRLQARQNLLDPNTSDDNSVDSVNSLSDGNSLDSLSADSSADEARPLPTSTRRPNLSSKTRARLAAKHRRVLSARQAALDSDSADSVNDSLDSGAESSADEAKPLRRPTRTQKRRARRTIEARQVLDSSADDNSLSDNSLNSVDSVNSLDSLNSLSDGNSSANEARPTLAPTNPPTLAQKTRNRLTAGQRAQHQRRSLEARQNLLDPNTSDDNSLSDGNSLDSLDSASDSDVNRPLPANPPNLTSKGPKRLGAGTVARPARINVRGAHLNRREILGKHADLVASAEVAAEAEVPSIAPPDLVNAPLDPAVSEEEEEDDAESVSSVSSDSGSEDEEEEDEEEEKETGTGTAQPTATATDGAAATTVDGGATATVTSAPSATATSAPEDVLAPVKSDDAAALPNLTLAPEATASPSGVVGAINGDAQADTQGQTTLVPVPKKMSSGAMVGIVLGILGFIAILAGFAFLFIKWRRRRQSSSSSPSVYIADEKGNPGNMPPGGNVPPITFTHPSWPNNNNNNHYQTQRALDPKTNSEMINDMMRAAYAAEGGGNNMAAAHADHYIDEKAYAMLAGHPPTPSVAGTEKRSVSKWLGDVMTPNPSTAPAPPRQSAMSQKWPYPVDPPMPAAVQQGQGPLPVGMPGYGNTGSTTKQKRLTPPRLPLKPVVPASLRPGAGAGGAVGGTGLPPGSNVNPRMTVVTATTDTTSSSARWG